MLEGHTMIDTGEKPFYCEICGNNCALKGSLRTHIKQNHDNNYVKIKRENPHECNVCGQKFDKSSRLKEHLFTHTGVKPNECHLCEEKFSFTDTLARHMETIHEKKDIHVEFVTLKQLQRVDLRCMSSQNMEVYGLSALSVIQHSQGSLF